jgi:hypothetical protein
MSRIGEIRPYVVLCCLSLTACASQNSPATRRPAVLLVHKPEDRFPVSELRHYCVILLFLSLLRYVDEVQDLILSQALGTWPLSR